MNPSETLAIVDVAAESGGAMTVLRALADYLCAERGGDGREYRLLVSTPVLPEEHPGNIREILLPEVKKSRLRRLLFDLFGCRRILRREGARSVLSMQNAAVRTSLRQTVYFHNVLLLESAGKYSFFRKNERALAIYTHLIAPYTLRSLRRAETVVCQTESVRTALLDKLPDLAVRRIYPDFSPECAADHSGERPVGFLMPAYPYPYKGHAFVLKALQLAAERGTTPPEVLFTFRGDEDSFAVSLKKQAEGLPVAFTGMLSREDILTLYTYRALLCAGELESFPMPLLEAMAAGAPIVACDRPYAKELLRGYENAFFFDPADPLSLCEALARAAESRYVAPCAFVSGQSEGAFAELLRLC